MEIIADPVRSEGNIQDIPRKSPSWASIVDAKLVEEDSTTTADADGAHLDAIDDAGRPRFTGKGAHGSADGNVNAGDAVRVKPVIAGTKGNAESRYKVSSLTGKDGTTGVAGSRICKKGPIREWVKTKRNVPESGEIVDSSVAWDFSDPKNPNGKGVQTRQGAVSERVCPASAGIKENAEVLQSTPVLGLGVEDFPPIRPLSVSGASIEASKLKSGSEKGRGATVTHNWRSLFVKRPKSCSTLAFYKPSKLDGKVTVNPPPEAVAEGVGLWEGSLVGQFFDKRLPVHVVKSFVERLWGKHEIPAISTTDNGWYIFRFRDMVARDWVLDNGPWYFAGRPIILRLWKPGMEMLNAQITSIPIWVKFFNIPLEYWTVTSLGYIASVVGIPMHLDTLTENHSRLSFARICIEVDVNCTFPKSALLDLGNGKYSTIRIEYPWVPQNCAHCKIFGHSLVKCKGVKEKVNFGETHQNHFDKGPAKDYIVDADSFPVNKAGNTAEEIDIHITTPGKAGNVQVSDIQERLTGNTFECLSICDDAGNPKVAVDTIAAGTDTTIPNVISTPSGVGSLESPKLDLINIAEFSDTSPVCETFKQVKRIDELDYLPLSKKKLKKLRKQEHATKSANSSSRVDTISPYIVGID